MKKIKILLAAVLMLACLPAIGQKKQIEFFTGSWQQALNKAEVEHKLIFLDAKTSWCVPCRILADSVFTQEKVADFFNQNFVNLSMDMEKGDGPALAKMLEVKSYPTLYFLKTNQRKVTTLVGLVNADSLLIGARGALAEKNATSDEEKFLNGPRDEKMVNAYFKDLLTKHSRGSEKLAIDSIVRQEGYDAFLQKKYWDILPVVNVNSPVGIWFVEHYDQFVRNFGKDIVDNRIAEMYMSNSTIGLLYKVSGGSLEPLKQKMIERKLPNLPYLLNLADFYTALKQGKNEKAYQLADSMLVNARPWQQVQLARWVDFLQVMQYDKRWLAAKWAAKAAALETDPVLKAIALQVVDDLMNRIVPIQYPSPTVYGYHV